MLNSRSPHKRLKDMLEQIFYIQVKDVINITLNLTS